MKLLIEGDIYIYGSYQALALIKNLEIDKDIFLKDLANFLREHTLNFAYISKTMNNLQIHVGRYNYA